MIRVKIHINWHSDTDTKECFNKLTPRSDYRWKNLILTSGEYDYLVIINSGLYYEHDPKKTICAWAEPVSTRCKFKSQGWNPNPRDYYFVYDTSTHHNFDSWFITLTYPQLLSQILKYKEMSGVVSDLRYLPGHKLRLDFITKVLDKFEFYTHYGNGDGLLGLKTYNGKLGKKELGLLPYRYSFGCENMFEAGYFTDKLIDPILCECLCFYYGCPNILDFFDPQAFVQLDLSDFQASAELVKKTIKDNEWEKRHVAIRAAKYKIMNELNPLEIIWKLIK